MKSITVRPDGRHRESARRPRPAFLAFLLIFAVQCSDAESPSGHPGEWRSWGGDLTSNHYSPLDDIGAENFGDLELAWRWESADARWQRRKDGTRHWRRVRGAVNITHFQGTPLMANGALYGTTSLGQVYSLDAGTGRERWVYDPESYRSHMPGSMMFMFPKHRGLAYWENESEARVLVATIDAHLLALDAQTGRRVASFGTDGRVDLLEGLRRTGIKRVAEYFQSSPPLVLGDVVVVGSAINDRPLGPNGIPGDIRGYDVATGELRWTFHSVPMEGEIGTETWEGDSWRYSGAANAWGPMSADPELGFVYLATSTPTSDFYGGHRLGDNLFAETLLCLDAKTGKRIWHYQLVHHGLWDYDPGAAPNLVDLDIGGKRIRAVAQVTKQGFTFVFDRVTGAPIFPIEERPVPASDVPGERTSETQPFPTRPPPFERQGVTEDDLIDFTPELRAEALEIFRRHRAGPVFTPPTLEGTWTLPGQAGGSNWPGAGFDPDTGVLYVPSITQPSVVALKASSSPDEGFRYEVADSFVPFVDGTPATPRRIPVIAPPFSRITAIDLSEGEIVWQKPNGDGPRRHPRLAHLNLPPLGSGAATCVLVTGTLLFAADGAGQFRSLIGEPIFRAYDKATGQVVGRMHVPARVRGCPMTYRHQGRQFIVFPIADMNHPPELVALALKER